MNAKTIVFDLDDTIISEIDFLKSAFCEIAKYVDYQDEKLFDEMFFWYQKKENVFLNLKNRYPHLEILELKNLYRNHFPDFAGKSEIKSLLLELKKQGNFLGLITDGFSITQRNKIKALEIENLFDLIIISEEFGSEKPNPKNYQVFDKFNTKEKYYIGDNVSKDFVTPNQLGWITICVLDDGKNIHSQDFNKDYIYLPQIKINKLTDLNNIIK
jgi:putative hydrolase of the HAD superfamily